jgi:ATP-dependent Clp protease ATP-binding subunit ClpX
MKDLARLPRVEQDDRLTEEHDRLVPLVCSFCGKSEDSVTHIVTGPGVNICDECVGAAVDIIEELESESNRGES